MTRTDPDPDDLIEELYAELAATEERPVTREAGWWLGEAQAVADDLRTGPATDAVVAERAERVCELLDHADETGDEDADECVERAREVARRLVDERSER